MSEYHDDQPRAEFQFIAMTLRRQVAAIAAAIAETEDELAATLDRIACVRPLDADRLRAKAMHARQVAADERIQAAIYRS